MTDRDIVERVGSLIERAVVPVRKRRAHHKTPYVTTIKGAPALALMRAIPVNRQSAEIAYPVMKVEMCDEGVVARVARLVGAPNVWRREAQKEGWNPTYIAAITGPQAAMWMRQLRDSMGTRRRTAIDAALAAYHPVYLVDAPASCVVPGCSEPHRGRGLCHKHYMMWSRDKTNGRDARITPLR